MVEPRIAVVGASLGGLRTAENLRSLGVTAPITLIGEEPHMPYNRPPLSKEFLSSVAEDQPAAIDNLYFKIRPELGDTSWWLGARVVASSLDGGKLILARGAEVAFDALVVATGLRPRRLAVRSAMEHRLVCRTVGDAIKIRSRISRGSKVVIAGGGFIGCELAATLTKLGAKVTVVEPFGFPMERALGPELAMAFNDIHVKAGVAFRIGRTITDLVCTPFRSLDYVVLDSGERLSTDLVIESIGSNANIEWLAGNNLDLTDGVLCDRNMRVGGRDSVVAVGDVARFPNEFIGPNPRRVEHWCVPGQTAKRAAETIALWMGKSIKRDESFAPLPSFWSDQYGLRIQGYGSPIGMADWKVLEGTVSAAGLCEGVAMGAYFGERLGYVVSVGLAPKRSLHYRSLVLAHQPKH